MRARWPLAAMAMFALSASVLAQPLAEGTTVTFVTCPVYRDTDMGRKSGCWLATDPANGQTYDVSFAPIKPQRDHELLVEGVVTSDPDVCGGSVLKPVRVSVLPGVCPSVKLAPEPYKGRPSPPATEVLRPASEPRTLPPGPYTPRTFDIYFELGRDFLIYQHAEVQLERVMLYAKASNASRVDIVGYAATTPLRTSGRSVSEPLALAESRAKVVAESLRRMKVPSEVLHVSFRGDPAPTDLELGRLPEPSKRRVTITVTP